MDALGLKKKGSHIINIDETCMVCSESGTYKVFSRANAKQPFIINAINLKEAYTVNVIN
jgi:hypothetical protein